MTATPDLAALTGVRYEAADGIARITLARPEAANAVDIPTARSVGLAVEQAAADPDVRVVLVSGDGPRFCSGGDVAAMLAAEDKPAAIRELAETFDAALQRLDSLDKPVVASVQGAVAGAGLGLMLACDLVVAARSTKLLTAYAAVGITPDCGVSWLLPRAVGQQRALELALTGRKLTADEALAWGLVNTVAADEDLAGTTEEMLARVAALPPFAAGQTRRLLRSTWDLSRADGTADEISTLSRAVASW